VVDRRVRALSTRPLTRIFKLAHQILPNDGVQRLHTITALTGTPDGRAWHA